MIIRFSVLRVEKLVPTVGQSRRVICWQSGVSSATGQGGARGLSGASGQKLGIAPNDRAAIPRSNRTYGRKGRDKSGLAEAAGAAVRGP